MSDVFDDALSDVRHAVRGFRKTPAFMLVAVATLALAIGANGFVFGILKSAALRPSEIADPDSLYQVRYGPRLSGSNLTTSYPAFNDFRQRTRTFADLIGIYACAQATSGRVY